MTNNKFEELMHFCCVDMGFCGCIKNNEPLHVTNFIPSTGPIHVDQFVEWIFLADDMNPNIENERWGKHKQEIREHFIKIMGSETVDARLLQYN